MNECLVTRLNGVVDNDSIAKLGCVRFSNEAGTGTLSGHFSIQGEGCKIEVEGGTFTVGSDSTPRTSYTIPDGNQKNFDLSNNNIKATVSNKYGIKLFNTGTAGTPSQKTNIKIEISDLDYCTALDTFNQFGATYDDINLGYLPALKEMLLWDCTVNGKILNIPVSLQEFDIRRCHIQMNTSDLADLKNLTKLVTQGSTIEGNIESLGTLKYVTQFTCDHCSGLKGELADLITALRTNRPSDAPSSVWFQFVKTQCTYNGSAISDAITINF